jgi:glycosyltransferase involved in cell wall biosynthesis
MSTTKPRVLTVTPRYLPEMGGVESHVQQVMTRLADEYEFSLVTSDNGLGLAPREVLDGVPVLRVPAYPRGRDWRFAPGVATAVRAASADLLHVQGVHTFVSVLAMAAARLRGLPYVVTFHTGGHSSQARNRIRGAQWRVIAPLLRGARTLVCVAEFERDFFSSVLRLPADRFVVIRNGGELPPAGDDATAVVPHRIISVGRLERYKGQHRLIAAMPLVREQVPDAELVLVGAGPNESALREEIGRRGLQDVVTITAVPPADRAAMGDLVGSAGIFALMSEYEAHPLAVMEAVALGKPAVVADSSGLGELARKGLAHAVPLDADDAAVAAALVRQLLDPQPPAGPVETSTWDSTAAGVAAVYREALRGPDERPDEVTASPARRSALAPPPAATVTATRRGQK